jgi:DNA-binding SARP family transcriptional activator
MAQTQPSIAKITRPVIPEVYPRKRLFRILDKQRGTQVTWISGPGGSGKTTLVSSYIDNGDLPCLWYRVDGGDSDLASFFYYMGLAGKKAAPRKRKPLPILTPEYLPGIHTFTQRYFEDLYGRLKPSSVVVFDNYQELPEDSNFHGIICGGLEAIPEGVRVIVVSRKDPPKEMACLRANKTVQIIGWEDLRLSPKETRGVIKLSGQKGLSKETVEQFQEKMKGWIGGMVLLLERTKREGIELLLEDMHTPEEIFDYFAGEIFNRTDRQTQDFLLRSSVLDEMAPETVEKLTGVKQADRILSALYNDNFFTERRLLPDGKAYRYHPLFREFLLSKAEGHFGQAKVAEIRQKAARFLEESGDIEAAAELFIQAGDLQGLIPLILKNAQTLAMQGRTQTLEKWLMSIPSEVVGSTPWLLFWLGMCRISVDQEESRRIFERVFEMSYEQKDPAVVFLSWTGIIQSILYSFESYTMSKKWILKLDEMISKFGGIPPGEIEMQVVSAMFNALVMRQPRHPDFDKWKARALEISNKNPDINMKSMTLLYLFYYETFTGSVSQMHEALERIKSLSRSKNIPPLALLNEKFVEGLFYAITAQKDKWIKTIDEGLKLSEESGVYIVYFYLLCAGADFAIKYRDLPLARKYLLKMEHALGIAGGKYDASGYYFALSLEALEKGDIRTALEHAKRALAPVLEIREMHGYCSTHVLNALVKSYFGEYEAAAEHISAVKQMSDFNYHTYERLFIEAHIAFKQGKDRHGLESLKTALTIGSKCGYMHLRVWNSSVMAGLFMKALEEGIEVEYVQEFIRRYNLAPDSPPLHIEDWPWAVKIYTMGRFAIVKDGKAVKTVKRARQKTVEMLKALIALGGREVAEEELSDLLWPEADGDTAHQAFATTLHRLRQFIGVDNAIVLRDGKLTLDVRYCWVDAWAFERTTGQIDTILNNLPGKAERETLSSLSDRCLQFYQGPFLGRDNHEPWTVSCRERQRSKFIRTIGSLSQYYIKAKDYDKAETCYQKGLEVDDLAEDFYRGLIKCYGSLGRKADASAVYKRCNKVLSTLGIKPSPETEKVYKRVVE